MIRWLWLVLFASMCLIGSRIDAADLPQVTPAQVGLNAERLAEIDGLVAAAISEKKLPGCVVLIGRPEGIAWLKAFGDKRLEPEREPMTDDTVFDLASLTKPLATATSIMKFVEQGKLSLDDPASKHISEFGVTGKEVITIRDLLVHRSGLIPDNAIADYADGPLKAKERLFALKLSAPVGSKFMYSDVNFMVLGEVVSRVSGRPLNEFAHREIFTPVGMGETMYLPTEPLRVRAAPTEQREGRWMQGEVHDPRAYKLGGVAGHAGLFGTARDLAKYATDALAGINHDQSRVLKQETWRTMTTRHTIEGTDRQGQPTRDVRGLGWDMQSRYSINRGTKFSSSAFGHGGFTGTALWIDPENKLYVIFLSNRVHPNGKGLVNPLAGKIGEIAVEALESKVGSGVKNPSP
ncbi:MAG: serine hydrolase domain-containing protein [Planctomycetota bacterium]